MIQNAEFGIQNKHLLQINLRANRRRKTIREILTTNALLLPSEFRTSDLRLALTILSIRNVC